jgi:hypothetical protein
MSKRRAIWILFAISITSAGGIGCSTAPDAVAATRDGTRHDWELQGRQLRAQVDLAYKRWGLHRSPGTTQRQSILEVFTPFIRKGTSFEEAEAILRAAGFDVRPPVVNQFFPEHLRHYRLATIEHYVSTPFGKTDIVVVLRPRTPQRYDVIETITADIIRSFL